MEPQRVVESLVGRDDDLSFEDDYCYYHGGLDSPCNPHWYQMMDGICHHRFDETYPWSYQTKRWISFVTWWMISSF